MNFAEAMAFLLEGKPIAREGWNGKNMFLYLVPPAGYAPTTAIASRYFEGEPVPYGGYVAIKSVDNRVYPWQPSQADMLAIDWTIPHVG